MQISEKTKNYLSISFCVFWLLCYFFLDLDGNWNDVLPFARASIYPDWIPGDWYLNRNISYRLPFNVIAGTLYQYFGLYYTFVFGKIIMYIGFAYVLIRYFNYFQISRIALTVFMPLICIYHSLGADEWLVNEFDTKAVSYILCLLSLLFFLEEKYKRFAIFLGLALSLHILVGGYFFISIVVPTFLLLKAQRRIVLSKKKLMKMFLLTCLFGANALVFAYFWISNRVSGEMAKEVTDISIWIRLSHHILPSYWDWQWIGIFAFAYVFVIAISCVFYKKSFSLLYAWTIGLLFLYALGLVFWKLSLWSLLCFYPFRVPDALLPFVGYLLLAAVVSNVLEKMSSWHWLKNCISIFLVFGSVYWALSVYKEDKDRFVQRVEEIPMDVFTWIRLNTAKTDIFLINPVEKYFYVFAERSSAVTFKHFPQLPLDIIVWKEEKFSKLKCPLENTGLIENRRKLKKCYNKKSVDELNKIAKEFGATYFLTEQKEAGIKPVVVGRSGLMVYHVY